MLDIDLLKSDGDLLFAELSITYKPNIKKYACPFHTERTPSMDVKQDGRAWVFYCFGCGKSGTIIDARKFRLNLRTTADALKSIEADFGFRFSKEDKKRELEIKPPALDMNRAERLVSLAHATLVDRVDIQERWMAGKRGLSLEVCQRYRIGFMESLAFQKWPSWQLQNAWVLPLTDSAGNLMSVKIHFETRPTVKGKPQGPKCISAPFGIEPADNPRHAWTGLWPAPEGFEIGDNKQAIEPLCADTDDLVASITKWPDDKRCEFINAVSTRATELYELFKWNENLSLSNFQHQSAEEIYARMRNRAPQVVEKSNDCLFLCPGELKAIAMISAGKHATSITSGESQKIPDSELIRLRGRSVCIVFDDDETGHRWRDMMKEKLKTIVKEISEMTYGRADQTA